MPQIDYLRLGTWDVSTYTKISVAIEQHYHTKPGHWLQYHGRRSQDGNAFHGTGEQNRERHHIIQWSGEQSDSWAKWCRINAGFGSNNLYCTRIDVQSTILCPKNYDGREFYELSKRSTRSIIENPETTTVYIGSRTSELMLRMYEKIVNDTKYLRCEFELKGAYSKNFWSAWNGKADVVDMLFASCCNKLKLPEPYKSWFNPEDDRSQILSRDELTASIKHKIAYLENTETAMIRYLHEHDMQQYTIAMIERLQENIRRLT